jgi:hypothetical protein
VNDAVTDPLRAVSVAAPAAGAPAASIAAAVTRRAIPRFIRGERNPAGGEPATRAAL